MISARDEFFLEREMANDLLQSIYNAGLSLDVQFELINILKDNPTEDDLRYIQTKINTDRVDELTRIKNGETLSAKEIKMAVKKAADNE